jgi:hypothetical protein
MNQSANVSSIDSIGRVKLALQTFEQSAGDALTAVEMQIRRAIDWLEGDQAGYWQNRIRRGQDQVSEAKLTLERCMMFADEGQRAACDVEKKDLEKAKRRLALAEEKLEAVRRWSRAIGREAAEYEAGVSALRTWLEADCPKSIASLERMIKSLDAYLGLQAPSDASAGGASAARSVAQEAAEQAPTDEKQGNKAQAGDEAANQAESGDTPRQEKEQA